ncbi:MAG: YHS domain-containing protein, partial [Acidobacteriota bacterium]|nr:YHS domain-containing protein [Acidobacteriota bacterium]
MTDPVCGMSVDPARAAGEFEQNGETYYFCSVGCRQKFAANPDRYRDRNSAPPVTVAGVAKYTCPMHPQIVRDEPGACPICGMALEPVAVTAEVDNTELHEMTRRFWIAAALSAPLLAFMFFASMPSRAILWIEFALATPAVLWSGWPLFERAWASIVNRSPNMFTLIGIGAGSAYFYSGIALVFNLGQDLYFEPAAVIVTLVLLGQVLELRARSQTTSALNALL